ncbi:hypothetical protein [Nocardiopsis dassonvillei]|uniref:hypothetical protein n=1 Tax=Nocardiopsis dassonvillei TaxID=2014 RepID=UPI0012FD9602|nr:hypothetical protein [Nocardiopsis dassonvillei]
MTWWCRARWLPAALTLVVVAWIAALLSAEQIVPFPTLVGPRAPVPAPYLICAMGLVGLVYGLDRSRSALESTAARSIALRDAALVGSVALACTVTGGAAAALGVPVAAGSARVMVAALGAYLVVRVVVRPDLAALAPLGLLTCTIVVWDSSTGPGPWLMAAPEDVGAWVLSAVLFVAGVFLVLRPPRRRFVRFGY